MEKFILGIRILVVEELVKEPLQGLQKNLVELGFASGRMKTGTPPRVDGRSLDYSKMEEQLGDKNPTKFGYLRHKAFS